MLWNDHTGRQFTNKSEREEPQPATYVITTTDDDTVNEDENDYPSHG